MSLWPIAATKESQLDWKQLAFKVCGEELLRRGRGQDAKDCLLDELIQAGGIDGPTPRVVVRSLLSPYEDYFDAAIAKKLEPTLQLWLQDKSKEKLSSSPQADIASLSEKLQELQLANEKNLLKIQEEKKEFLQALQQDVKKPIDNDSDLVVIGCDRKYTYHSCKISRKHWHQFLDMLVSKNVQTAYGLEQFRQPYAKFVVHERYFKLLRLFRRNGSFQRDDDEHVLL